MPRNLTTSPTSASRWALPNRRHHITQKVRIAGHRGLYLTVHNDPQPGEIFIRVRGAGVTSETVALYDVIARLLSISLQCGAPH